MINKIRNKNKGVIALLLVIMITALTVVSAVVVSMTNISDLMSSYYFSESEEVDVDMDACLEDALFRLSSSTAISGDYYLNSIGTNCNYQIAVDAVAGLKTVTTTASTTSDIGYWENTVVVQVNVSSTPIGIDSYKNFNMSYAGIVAYYCGDTMCDGSENCTSCEADCGACGGSDTTPPEDIGDLVASHPSDSSIQLDWTAPGDDGASGTATSYDVRYSEDVITSENFDAAMEATGEPSPSPAGDPDTMIVSGLRANTPYYFAIKTSDEVPNESGISNVAEERTGIKQFSCFPAGTKILMQDNSYKNIEDVKVGEMVLSYDEKTGKQVASKVLELEAPIRDHMCEITFSQGLSLKLTNEHPIFTDQGWKSINPTETLKENSALFVRKLEKGDKVFFADSTYKSVEQIKCWDETIQTYNLKHIEKYNNFYAENVLAHNKLCGYLFSQEDGEEYFEFVTLGVFEEPGNSDSKFLLDRMFIENEGYSYINLEKETNKFVLRIPPHEIDYIDYLALRVIDTLDENHFSFWDKDLDSLGLLDKEKIYNLKLVDSSEGYDLLVNEDANRFALDGETKYPHELSLVFEELPAKEEGYVRKVQFVEKGYYEAFNGSAIWYDFAPFNQPKWRDWLLKDDNYNELKEIIVDISDNHYKIGGNHSSLFEEKRGSFSPVLFKDFLKCSL